MKKILGILLVMLILCMPVYGKSRIDELQLMELGEKVTTGQVAYNGEKYIYVAPKISKVYISKDGRQWEENEARYEAYPMEYFVSNLKEVLWDKKQFVAVTEHGIITSTDGIEWKERPLIDSKGKKIYFDISDLAYINGIYSLVGTPAPEDDNYVGLYFAEAGFLYSNDLLTFYEGTAKDVGISFGGTRPVEQVIHANGKILGFGTDETVMISQDGKHWQGYKGTFVGGKGIWDGQKYVTALGKSIWTSKDGVNWKEVYQAKHTAAPYLRQVTFNGHAYIATGDAVGKNAKQDWIYYYSTNGIEWEERILPGGNMNVYDAYGTKDGFIVGGNKLYHLQTSGDVKGQGGSNVYVPKLVSKPEGYGIKSTQTNESVRQITKSYYTHMMAVTDQNNLYEWGNNLMTEGQASIGVPRKVLSNVKKAIEAFSHAGAITYNNELYMWGSNDGQAIIDLGEMHVPYPVKVMEGVEDAAISSGTTYVVKDNGDLLVKGRYSEKHAMFGQVYGSATRVYYDEYTKIAENVRRIETEGYTNAYITKNNELYMWGWNDAGELGLGHYEDQMKPIKVMDNVKDVKLDTGRTLVLTQKGEVYAFGNVGEILGLDNEKVNKPHKIATNIKQIDQKDGRFMMVNSKNELLQWRFKDYVNGKSTYDRGILTHKNIQQGIADGMQPMILTTNGEIIMLGANNEVGQLGDGTTEGQWEKQNVKISSFKPRQLPSADYIQKNSLQALYYNGKKVIDKGIFKWNGKTYVAIKELVNAKVLELYPNTLFGEYTLVSTKTNRKATFTYPIVMEVGGRGYIPLRELTNELRMNLQTVAGGIEIIE